MGPFFVNIRAEATSPGRSRRHARSKQPKGICAGVEVSRDHEQLPFFVYGTLRPGQKNYSRYLQGRTLDEIPATCRGGLFFVKEGGYPYLVPGKNVVTGELLYLDPKHYDSILAGLDELEEYDPQDEEGSVYLRRKTVVSTAWGEEREAWVYYWNCPQVAGREIKSGDFRDR
jgi:gamma-glutamylcyclotransferase (GGCT)/AIG2-like uncharacterized protein YtfP